MKKFAIGLLAPALGLLLLLAWPALAPAQRDGAETAPAAPGVFAQQPDAPETGDQAAAVDEEAATVTDLPPAPDPQKAVVPTAGFSVYGLDMIKALGAFILVLLLLILALKTLGRLGRGRGFRGRGSVFELHGIQALDSRKFLAAVEVKGRFIVVGVTPDRITPVAHWPLDQFSDDDGLDFSAPHAVAGEADLEFTLPAREPRPGRRGGLDGPPDISVADREEPEK